MRPQEVIPVRSSPERTPPFRSRMKASRRRESTGHSPSHLRSFLRRISARVRSAGTRRCLPKLIDEHGGPRPTLRSPALIAAAEDCPPSLSLFAELIDEHGVPRPTLRSRQALLLFRSATMHSPAKRPLATTGATFGDTVPLHDPAAKTLAMGRSWASMSRQWSSIRRPPLVW